VASVILLILDKVIIDFGPSVVWLEVLVTTFTFQAHPVTNVFGGPTLWPIENKTEIMKWYHEFLK
jgi:hypothetical protein